jgi:hypothetical protein
VLQAEQKKTAQRQPFIGRIDHRIHFILHSFLLPASSSRHANHFARRRL